jgi:ABC-type dipeptide/oligopeptide/nickel transport system permease component
MTGGVLPFVLRRLLLVPPTLFAVLLITFAFTQAVPGDPVRIITGTRTPDPEVAEQIREEFGLNGSFFERFGDYFAGLVTRGDLGPSYFHRSPQRSVAELLGERIWVSTQLGLISLGLILLLGIPIGVFAAMNRGTWRDPSTIGFFMIFDAVPVIVLIPLLIWVLVFGLSEVPAFFGFNVPSVWTPGDAASYIVPVTALTLPALAGMARFVRVSVLNVLDEDYVRTARAKGLAPRTVVVRHVLRNSLLPLSTVMALSIVTVVTGAILTETLYGVPGVGAFVFASIGQRDFNVILGFTLLVATLFVIANLVIDVAYIFIDPRIRYSRRA